MYKVTSKLKIVAFALMILGAVLTAVGFWQMPGSEEEVKEGYILGCQARPASLDVLVDFDEV